MKKQNFITTTLIITGLALNPALGMTIERKTSQNQTINNNSITSSISTILHNRGLDQETAQELADNFLDENDEVFLTMMMHYLENQNIVNKEEVLTYLSQVALHKQNLDVTSYDHLMGMVTAIKQKPLDENTRKQLSQIAKANGRLS